MVAPLNIIVVEDNLALQELLVDHLSKDGHDVAGVSSSEELDEWLIRNRADVLLLDINLPGEDGFSIAKRIRGANKNIYIVILSARSAEKDKIRGYENGADIYLAKPVSPIEVSSVINNISFRLSSGRNDQVGSKLDVLKMELATQAESVKLTSFETALLKMLSESSSQRLDYWKLMEIFQKEPNEKNKSALGVFVFRLNQKLEKAGCGKSAIKSVFNEGYQLTHQIELI